MAYQAIYRKWRPMVFEDIVGQSHITTTLKNQILSNTVGHAYLFCGTRGTGKTTAAKVFARAINCTNNTTGSPCNECEVCRGLIDGSILDVTEIDAASNNKVENIRDLIDDTKYSTSIAKYRIYIVDEVHMLSNSAHNALLKTLEEPPEHVIFILATTEPHKIPQTILSRCQRYDFRRITPGDIILRLREIAYGDGYKLTDDAFKLIARLGDGSMRDAISILERVVSSVSGEEITYDEIVSILGIVPIDQEFKMAEAVISKNTTDVFLTLDEVVNSGRDLNVFMDSLISHFRNLLVCKVTAEPEKLIDYSIDEIVKFKAQAQRANYNQISHIISSLYNAKSSAKWVKSPRAIYEVELIRLSAPEIDTSLDALFSRVSDVEEKIKNGIVAVANSQAEATPIEEKPKIKAKTPSKKLYNPIPKELQTAENPYVVIAKKWDKISNVIKKENGFLSSVFAEGNVAVDNDGILLIFDNTTGLAAKSIADEYKNQLQDAFTKTTGSDAVIKTAYAEDVEDSVLNFWDFPSNEVAASEEIQIHSTDEDPLVDVLDTMDDFIKSVDDSDFVNYDQSKDDFTQSSIDDEPEEFLDKDEESIEAEEPMEDDEALDDDEPEENEEQKADEAPNEDDTI